MGSQREIFRLHLGILLISSKSEDLLIAFNIWESKLHGNLGLVFHAWQYWWPKFSSAQLSCSVVSDSLRPHESQHARPPCPSPTPGVYSNSCPLSHWCHSAISSSVVPFSSHLQSFPASWSFQMSQFFASGGQSIAVSASASVLPMNTQDWFPLGWTGWISLQSRDSQESSPTPQFKSINSLVLSFLYSPTLTSIRDHRKTIALTRWWPKSLYQFEKRILLQKHITCIWDRLEPGTFSGNGCP